MVVPLFSPLSDNPSSSTTAVTRDEFNVFHKSDRTLYSRLVFGLKRDLDQSFLAMGFLLLLEQSGYARHVVAYLVSSPDAFVDAVANEISVCISILYNQDFASTLLAANNDDNAIIPLLLRMTGGRLTIRLINQSRETFCIALTKNWTEFCTRAFSDIYDGAQRSIRERLMALEREKFIEDMKNLRLGTFQQGNPNRLSVQQATIPSPLPLPLPPAPVGEETNKTAAGKRAAEEEKAAADDRTVFLTFSKGYPISEEEVWNYFTRRFGEVIEAVEMQEVEDNEQPLFAKMVLKLQCVSMMDEIVVSARSRNKFTINGKHVWARKYVRKNLFSASSSTHI